MTKDTLPSPVSVPEGDAREIARKFLDEVFTFIHHNGPIENHLTAAILSAESGGERKGKQAEMRLRILSTARPEAEWHEDLGDVLWWQFPVEEAPYVGSPLDTDWPGYHTHWTPLPAPPSLSSPEEG